MAVCLYHDFLQICGRGVFEAHNYFKQSNANYSLHKWIINNWGCLGCQVIKKEDVKTWTASGETGGWVEVKACVPSPNPVGDQPYTLGACSEPGLPLLEMRTQLFPKSALQMSSIGHAWEGEEALLTCLLSPQLFAVPVQMGLHSELPDLEGGSKGLKPPYFCSSDRTSRIICPVKM
jgi:hypothetical protein